MPTKDEKPVTRVQFLAKMRAALKPYMTKAEIRKILDRYSSKEDLDSALRRCATMKDVDARIMPIVLEIGRIQDQLDHMATRWDSLEKKSLVHDERLRVLEDRCPPAPATVATL